MMITIIGRGHSGTRAISETLSRSGFYMGEPLNGSWDLVPPDSMYNACREFAAYVTWKGGLEWDFSRVLSMEPTEKFRHLIEDYLSSVLASDNKNKGWKIPETTLCYPWILKLFPDMSYIHWVRDPRDCVLSGHMTDDLHDFGVDYPETNDIRTMRAISWRYQRELMKVTPEPAKLLKLRFEDMVFEQDKVLTTLGEFIGTTAAKIEMRPDSVGRYKLDNGVHMFDFFLQDLNECGYEM